MKSWIEVSADRLAANYKAVQAAAGSAFEVVAVIKADAYGHGAELCAPVLAGAGARWFGVTDLEEGERVRGALNRAGYSPDDVHLLIMCGMEPEDAPGILRAGLTPVVWTEQHIAALEDAAAQTGKRVAVHVEVDTGMARQGIAPGTGLEQLAQRLWNSKWVRCEGVFSHLSSAEVAGSAATSAQKHRFHQSVAEMSNGMLLPEYVHLANTSGVDEGSTLGWLRAATMSLRAGQQLMVRTGLALYGYALALESAGQGIGLGNTEAEPLRTSPAEPERLAIAATQESSSGPAYASAFGTEDGDWTAEGALRPNVAPVATWKTRIIGLREIAAGETVGYGATFISSRPMRLALLPVGYADGFRREASSGVGDGWVVVGEQRANVVGRVSMNLTVVDVTALPEVRVGDPVTLLGAGVTAEDHAAWCGTIPYEILCGMRGHRVLC